MRKTTAMLAAGGLAALALTGSAYAGQPGPTGTVNYSPAAEVVPGDNTVTSVKVKNGSLFASDLDDDVVRWFTSAPDKSVYWGSLNDGIVSESKLAPDVKAKLNRPDYGSASLGSQIPLDETVITNIGGPFATRATKVGEFDLLPGTWSVNLAGVFHTNEAIPAGVRPQLALRYDASPTTGDGDAGTIMGAELSPLANRELTGTSTRIVHTDQTIKVTVWAFGYTDTAGTEGSGKITAAGSVTLVKVGN